MTRARDSRRRRLASSTSVVARPVAKRLLRWVGNRSTCAVPERSSRAWRCSFLLSGLPAHAHEELSLHAMTVLRQVAPDVPGLEVRVVHMGAPALAVRNDTGKTLTVFDESDRPFLRIGSAGVFANAESPLSYRSVDPAADGVPDGLNGAPRWIRARSRIGMVLVRPSTHVRPRCSGVADRDDAWRDTGRRTRRIRTSRRARSLQNTDRYADGRRAGDSHCRGSRSRSLRSQRDATRSFTSRESRANPSSASVLPVCTPTFDRPATSPPRCKGSRQFRRTSMQVPLLRWKRVSELPIWGWLERRAAVPSSLQERSLLGSERRPVLEWTTDMRLGERSLPLDGRVLWVPPHSDQLDLDRREPRTDLLGLRGSGARSDVVARVARSSGEVRMSRLRFDTEEVRLGYALYRTQGHCLAACELNARARRSDALLQAARPMTDVLPWLESEARSVGAGTRILLPRRRAHRGRASGDEPQPPTCGDRSR